MTARSSATATPRITVCVPVIGRLDYLDSLMASLLSQTVPDFEVIILDSGSQPAARARYERIARDDARIRVARVEERIPMFANFNRGLTEARGEFIAFFHDDDVYLPRFLEVLGGSLEVNPTAVFAGSNYFLIDDTGRRQGLRKLIRRTGLVSGRSFTRDLVRRGRGMMHTSGLVYRTRILRETTFDERLSMHFGDFVVLMRLAERGDVFLREEPLMEVRQHAGAASSRMPLSEGTQLRTRLFSQYAGEFLRDNPGEARFVEELRRGIRRSHMIGLAWGWLAAPAQSEAEACVRALGPGRIERLAAGAFGILESIGLSLDRRKRLLSPAVRRLGRRVG